MVTHSWRASQEKVHKLHQRYIFKKGINELAVGLTVYADHIQSIKDRQQKRMSPCGIYIYIPYISFSDTLSDTGVYKHKKEHIFIQDQT